MTWFLFGKFSINALTQLLLALIITGYLISVKGKSRSTWMLIGFFAAFTLTLLSNFLLFSMYVPWRYIWGYSQGLTLFVGVIALIQFAYHFPENRHPRESKIALGVSILLLFVMREHILNTVSNISAGGNGIAVASAVFLLEVIWIVSVLMRKTSMFSDEDPGDCQRGRVKCCLWPQGKQAKALRSFAMLMCVLVFLGSFGVLEGLGIISLETMTIILSSGYLLFLFTFVLVYVNNSTEPSTFQVKMVGISLLTMLVVMGVMGTFILRGIEKSYVMERLEALKDVSRALVQGQPENMPALVNHVVSYPLNEVSGDAGSTVVFARPGAQRTRLHEELIGGELTSRVIADYKNVGGEGLRALKRLAMRTFSRMDLVRLQQEYRFAGLVPDLKFSVYYFTLGDYLFEVSFDHQHYLKHMDGYASKLVYFILGGSVVILLVFPLFVRSSLSRPLQSLLAGVKQVNEGDLDVSVPIHVEDEIGYVSRSFNSMVASIKEKNETLTDYANELERRVEERTRDLSQKNGELETAIRELHETQERLLVQEEMASLGQLVAGVAHEINNPVGVVNSSADVSNRSLGRLQNALEESPSIEALKESRIYQQTLKSLKDNNGVILEAGERIARLVRSLRNFIRLDEAEFQTVDVHEGLESTLDLLHHQMGDRVTVERSFGDLPKVYCHPGQLNQVFMNVLKNAIEGIQDKGRITVETTAGDGQVTIRIRDDGVGIASDRLKRIFDFGFQSSTTRVKMGTGLSTAYNILQSHKGEIQIESEAGEGTAVTIILPTTR